jgi:hypothetical protein
VLVTQQEHRGEYYCAAKKNPHWVCKICGSFPLVIRPDHVLTKTSY